VYKRNRYGKTYRGFCIICKVAGRYVLACCVNGQDAVRYIMDYSVIGQGAV